MYLSCVWLGVALKTHSHIHTQNTCLNEIIVHALNVLSILDSTIGIIGEPYIYAGRTGGLLKMHRLSLRFSRLTFETSRNLPIILEESIKHTSNE